MIKQHLQESIQKRLADKGWSSSAFARMLGVSRQMVYVWLKTTNVSYDKLIELTEFVGLEIQVSVRYKDVE